MKKTLLLFSLFATSFSQALYMGNPSSPEIIEKGLFIDPDFAFGVKIGYQGDFVFNRNAELQGHGNGKTDSYTIYRNQGVLTFSLFDRADLYASLGAMQVNFSNRAKSDRKRREYDFHDQFTWGGGGRVIVFEWGKVCFGADGKYQQATPNLRWVTVNGASVSSHSSLMYKEWQVGAGFTYDADIFYPYFGATYSHLHSHLKDISGKVGLGTSSFTLGSREHFGLALGCGLSSGEIVDLNVEVRFFDEQSLTLAGNIKF